ncbi:MAG: cysteine desulfurase [Clostridiales bacterium]|jgi:cysteine desulfurase|nr:cysteine desulfurase [Clostridiales bacterium]
MIYLDNAATTKMRDECLGIIAEYSCSRFFNPSAPYKPSADLSRELKDARESLKKLLHAPDGEIVFTASGTEADNFAVFCSPRVKNGKILVSASEHSAVLASAAELEARGADVTYLPVKKGAAVDLDALESSLDERVSFVSVMHVNNETGAVNDLARIAALIKKYAPNALFHSDGVQAFGKIPVNLINSGVDMYSVSAHKLRGPKGVGALFVKKGVRLKPFVFGGGQENGLRSATENVAGILAFTAAAGFAVRDLAADSRETARLRAAYRDKILAAIPGVIINEGEENSPNILNLAFKDLRGEVLLHSLEKRGIYVGLGSACSSKKRGRLGGLLNLPEGYDEGIIRISLSPLNADCETDTVAEALAAECEILRKFKRV